uniref:Uncharacterized protein n=1 Tax=Arundo donax TaxID=35708 RepID=A0A0A8ZF06_ARUDO
MTFRAAVPKMFLSSRSRSLLSRETVASGGRIAPSNRTTPPRTASGSISYHMRHS